MAASGRRRQGPLPRPLRMLRGHAATRRAVHPISAVQSEYSLFTRDVEDALLPACRALGVGFVAYSPLGRGLLTGAVAAPVAPSARDVRAFLPRFSAANLGRNLRSSTRSPACGASRLLARAAGARLAPRRRSERRPDPGHQAASASGGERRGGSRDARRGRRRGDPRRDPPRRRSGRPLRGGRARSRRLVRREARYVLLSDAGVLTSWSSPIPACGRNQRFHGTERMARLLLR